MLYPAPGSSVADMVGTMARGLEPGEPLTFARHVGDDDAYLRGTGSVMFVVPGIWSGMPAPLLAAMRARRAASCTGRCPSCDATLALAEGAMFHENDCHAGDDRIVPMLNRWIRKVGVARGRRLQEIPSA